jgi:hypothetical protein
VTTEDDKLRHSLAHLIGVDPGFIRKITPGSYRIETKERDEYDTLVKRYYYVEVS